MRKRRKGNRNLRRLNVPDEMLDMTQVSSLYLFFGYGLRRLVARGVLKWMAWLYVLTLSSVYMFFGDGMRDIDHTLEWLALIVLNLRGMIDPS